MRLSFQLPQRILNYALNVLHPNDMARSMKLKAAKTHTVSAKILVAIFCGLKS
jgi:hypothetical protein